MRLPVLGYDVSYSISPLEDGVLDLTEFDELLLVSLTADLSRLSQGPRDAPIWHVALDGMLAFSSAKSLLHTLSLDPNVL